MLSDGIDFPSVALRFDPTTFVSRGRAFAHCRKGPTCSFVPLMLGLGHYGARKSHPSAEGSALGLKSRILISNILPEGGVGVAPASSFCPRGSCKPHAKACFDREELPAAQAVSLGADARTWYVALNEVKTNAQPTAY
jgi:hypothetical protein